MLFKLVLFNHLYYKVKQIPCSDLLHYVPDMRGCRTHDGIFYITDLQTDEHKFSMSDTNV